VSASPRTSEDDSYVVRAADNLLISVWKEPGFSGPVVVSADGMITLPVIGDVQVVGLTVAQVQELVTEKLKPVVTEPQVTVIRRGLRTSSSRDSQIHPTRYSEPHPKGYTLEERIF
jgi:protein involved in polysaccharide export with SLBB domain